MAITDSNLRPGVAGSRLTHQVAIVTGGGHGIGRAIARRLAEDGAAVAIAELDAVASAETADELLVAGHRATGIQTDISDESSVVSMTRAVLHQFERIDILVNNAAMFLSVPMSRARFDEISPEEWDRMLEVNLKGTWLVCRAVVPEMRKRGYGKIVNIGSAAVFKRLTTRIHYITSKAGIIGFTRVLASELGPDGITVNCVAPGSVMSNPDADEESLALQHVSAQDRAIARVQLPEDLVGAVSFFCSSDSDFVTGQTLIVDGGSSMR